MSALIIQIVVSIVGGIASSLQASFAGLMGQRVGELGSVLITYAVGGVVIATIILFSGSHNLGQWRSLPWYVYAAGPLGLVLLGALSYTIPRLGTASAVTLFIMAWLTISALTDHYAWFGVAQRSLDLTRLLGIGALIFGAWLVVR